LAWLAFLHRWPVVPPLGDSPVTQNSPPPNGGGLFLFQEPGSRFSTDSSAGQCIWHRGVPVLPCHCPSTRAVMRTPRRSSASLRSDQPDRPHHSPQVSPVGSEIHPESSAGRASSPAYCSSASVISSCIASACTRPEVACLALRCLMVSRSSA